MPHASEARCRSGGADAVHDSGSGGSGDDGGGARW